MKFRQWKGSNIYTGLVVPEGIVKIHFEEFFPTLIRVNPITHTFFTFCISTRAVIYKKNLRVHFGPHSFDMFKPLQHNDSTLNLLFSFIATLFLHLPYYILFIKLAHLSSPKRNTAHEQMAQCKQQWIYYNLTIYTYGTSVKHLSKFKWLFRMIF